MKELSSDNRDVQWGENLKIMSLKILGSKTFAEECDQNSQVHVSRYIVHNCSASSSSDGTYPPVLLCSQPIVLVADGGSDKGK